MFNKILIANRGEIAVRVARTARRLGIASVAVYSSADRDALHVEACDEARHIGGAAASASYLNGARILEVAQQCGADAIHPGYGFLSENAAFARDCADVGIVFIGPPASAIEAMGSKSRAKALMQKAGVPLVPGYHGDAQDEDTIASEAGRIGFPLLIKASAGGGGKGMRVVEKAKDLAASLTSARRESKAAFGDDRVLLERYLSAPRHVEMQIFADEHGHCVHLFERDCSIQRRHQKVIEEAPAPGVDDALRARMGEAAIDCAQAIGYRGAGTVEFLLDADGSFFFMEMNTRLQVEHPVTEMITGQDLVEWQLRIASGEALPLGQDEIRAQGHAIEARVYAEAPRQDFMPAAGRIAYLRAPDCGDGVRIDTGVRSGDAIGIHYDPMIAKLVAHGADREAARAKLARALRQYQILGLHTNISFLLRVVTRPEFIAASIDTGFIASHQDALFATDTAALRVALVLAAAALQPGLDQRANVESRRSPWDSCNHWRMNLPSAQHVTLLHGDRQFDIEIRRDGNAWLCLLEDEEYRFNGSWTDVQRLRVEVNGRIIDYPAVIDRNSVALSLQGEAYRFALPISASDVAAEAADAEHPRAPMSGAVVALPVAVGDTVAPGDTLIVIEAMKMEHAIVARVDARVDEILFAVGDQVDEGDTLVTLEVTT